MDTNKNNEIKINDLNEMIRYNSCVFLCGNGFSMNFDNDFRNIFSRLYKSHKILLENGVFKTITNSNSFKKKNMTNYNQVINYLKYSKEKEIIKIFDDAFLFAESIVCNKKLIDFITKSKLITDTTINMDEIQLVKQIYYNGKKGVEYVNIEHWTTLIYMYFLIKELNIPKDIYEIPNNLFTNLIYIGNTSKILLNNENYTKEGKILESTLFNGFNIYYRMLFSIAIFNNGKSINYNKLEKINQINLNKLVKFLNNFKSILTLNYDKILEQILDKKIYHLHGEFILNKQEIVANQILGLKQNNDYISFSDILIGDYFCNKIRKNMINTFAGSRYPFVNKKTKYTSTIINEAFDKHNINTLLIVGMSIDNDQHILREIMCNFYDNNIKNPTIVYGFYGIEDKKMFYNTFYKVITFNEDMNKYIKENINIKYVNVKENIDKFLK